MLSTMFVGNGQKSATYGNVSRFVDGKIHRLIEFGSCYVADITTHFHLNGKDQFSVLTGCLCPHWMRGGAPIPLCLSPPSFLSPLETELLTNRFVRLLLSL